VFFFAVRSLVKPLHKLAVSADELAKGNFNVQLPIIKKDDEIGRLRDSFENMQESLKKYIEDLKEATAVTAVIENELKIAHAIQMAMLPHFFTDNPGRSDVGIFGSLTPAKAVGGDLFDFVFRDDKLYFCIADVSGKGIPASLVMAVTRSLFRAVLSRVEGPAKIAASLNDVISDGNENNMFVTFFVGELDLKTGVLDFCNAGHNAPFLITSDVEMLAVESNLPLGVMQDWNFVEQQITIQPGTSMFLYTDGLNEAENAEHGQFGDERTISVLRQCVASHLDNPRQLIEQMTAEVHDFVGDAEQSDDMTMLSIKMNNLKK
jgi:sigma-B regulation protein RsbU (phosphoserine phosphatase)